MDEGNNLFIENFKKLKNEIEEEYGLDKIDDNKIKKFLIAREYDVEQAFLMLKKDIEWRKANNIDTILDDYYLTEVMEKYCTTSIIGFDKEDFAIMVSNFGKMDHRGFAKSTTDEECFRFCTYIIERAIHMKKNSKEIGSKSLEKFTIICDLGDLPMYQISSKKVINRCIQICMMYDAHYPEMLNTVYFINSPTAFQLLYGIVTPFVAPKTLLKLKVYGKNGWKEDLLKVIDSKVLPAYLGGEKTDPDGNPMCHSIVCHGGTIPERLFLKNMNKPNFKNQPGVKSHILRRKSKFDLPLQVKLSGSVIEWEFEIDNYDIGFGLLYKSVDASEEEEVVPLIPLQRSNSHLLRETGTFKCENPGTYILTLDNSYSFFRSKSIYYKVSVFEPDQD